MNGNGDRGPFKDTYLHFPVNYVRLYSVLPVILQRFEPDIFRIQESCYYPPTPKCGERCSYLPQTIEALLKDAMRLSAANSTVTALQRVYLYSSCQAMFILRAPMPYDYFHLSTEFLFFVCSLVCVNFCSFAHYSGVKLVPPLQNLFVSAKLNTFRAIMQNYVIFLQ
jgi:hypothetical protein